MIDILKTMLEELESVSQDLRRVQQLVCVPLSLLDASDIRNTVGVSATALECLVKDIREKLVEAKDA